MAYYFMNRDKMVLSKSIGEGALVRLALDDVPLTFTVSDLASRNLTIGIEYAQEGKEITEVASIGDVKLSTGKYSRRLFGISVDISNLISPVNTNLELPSKGGPYRKAAEVSFQKANKVIYDALQGLSEETVYTGTVMNYQAVIAGMGLGKPMPPDWLVDFLMRF